MWVCALRWCMQTIPLISFPYNNRAHCVCALYALTVCVCAVCLRPSILWGVLNTVMEGECSAHKKCPRHSMARLWSCWWICTCVFRWLTCLCVCSMCAYDVWMMCVYIWLFVPWGQSAVQINVYNFDGIHRYIEWSVCGCVCVYVCVKGAEQRGSLICWEIIYLNTSPIYCAQHQRNHSH